MNRGNRHWRGIIIVLATLAWVSPGALRADSEIKALVGGRLIDGFGGRPVANSVIIVEGERIRAVGRMGEIEIPEQAEIISTEGMDVLPGLWDMHVH